MISRSATDVKRNRAGRPRTRSSSAAEWPAWTDGFRWVPTEQASDRADQQSPRRPLRKLERLAAAYWRARTASIEAVAAGDAGPVALADIVDPDRHENRLIRAERALVDAIAKVARSSGPPIGYNPDTYVVGSAIRIGEHVFVVFTTDTDPAGASRELIAFPAAMLS